MADPVRIVLFDLGGVLVQLRGISAMKELAGIENDNELWHRWLTCRWVQSFESGLCSQEDFARGIIDDWALPVGPLAFLDDFASWVVGPYAGAEDLVQQVKAAVAVSCFSNTNELHWVGKASAWPIVQLFDHRFLSYQMGMAKPDRRAFEHVSQQLNVPSDRVLFLDDNILNTRAAEAVGFRTASVSGVDEARRALVDAGVIQVGT